MIEEQALVVKVEQHRVWVTSNQAGACGQCAQKTSCSTQAIASVLNKKPLAVEVDSVTRLNVGDTVVVAIDESLLLLATLLMYMFPLLSLFAGAGLVDWLLPDNNVSAEGWTAAGALAGLLLSLCFVHRVQHIFLFNICTRPVVVKKL